MSRLSLLLLLALLAGCKEVLTADEGWLLEDSMYVTMPTLENGGVCWSDNTLERSSDTVLFFRNKRVFTSLGAGFLDENKNSIVIPDSLQSEIKRYPAYCSDLNVLPVSKLDNVTYVIPATRRRLYNLIIYDPLNSEFDDLRDDENLRSWSETESAFVGKISENLSNKKLIIPGTTASELRELERASEVPSLHSSFFPGDFREPGDLTPSRLTDQKNYEMHETSNYSGIFENDPADGILVNKELIYDHRQKVLTLLSHEIKQKLLGTHNEYTAEDSFGFAIRFWGKLPIAELAGFDYGDNSVFSRSILLVYNENPMVKSHSSIINFTSISCEALDEKAPIEVPASNTVYIDGVGGVARNLTYSVKKYVGNCFIQTGLNRPELDQIVWLLENKHPVIGDDDSFPGLQFFLSSEGIKVPSEDVFPVDFLR